MSSATARARARRDPRSVATELESYLADFQVSSNMLSGNPCNLASYGAILDYNKLEAAITAWPDAQWTVGVMVWEHDAYLSPAIRLLAKWTMLILQKQAVASD